MKRPIWFKRKTYGWGWTPATWQGWAILGIYTGGLLSLATKADNRSFLPLIGMTAILIVVTYLTGERARWQWGKPGKSKNGNE